MLHVFLIKVESWSWKYGKRQNNTLRATINKRGCNIRCYSLRILFIAHEICTETASDKHALSPPSKRSRLNCSDELEYADANDADDADDNVREPVSAPLVFKDVNGIFLPSVPNGIKNNVMFVTRIAVDPVRQRVSYFDDCGASDSGKGAKVTTQYLRQGDRLVFIAKRGDPYCTGGRNWKVDAAVSATRIDTDCDWRTHRYYATLTADPRSKKRVAWFTNLPDSDGKAVWEYQGERHGWNAPHGNAKLNDRPHVQAYAVHRSDADSVHILDHGVVSPLVDLGWQCRRTVVMVCGSETNSSRGIKKNKHAGCRHVCEGFGIWSTVMLIYRGAVFLWSPYVVPIIPHREYEQSSI